MPSLPISSQSRTLSPTSNEITLTNAAAVYFYIVNLSNFDFAVWEQVPRTVPYALRYKLSNAQELMHPLRPPRPIWQIQRKLNLGFRTSRGFLA